MGGIGVPKRVNRNRLVNVRLTRRCFHRLLNNRVADVVTTDDAGARIGRERVAGEHPEPGELAARLWVLALERIREPHAWKA